MIEQEFDVKKFLASKLHRTLYLENLHEPDAAGCLMTALVRGFGFQLKLEACQIVLSNDTKLDHFKREIHQPKYGFIESCLERKQDQEACEAVWKAIDSFPNVINRNPGQDEAELLKKLKETP